MNAKNTILPEISGRFAALHKKFDFSKSLIAFCAWFFLLVSGLKDRSFGFGFTQKGHRTREIWTEEDRVAAAAGKLGSCRRRRSTSKIHPGQIRPRKIFKFGPDVPEIHKMFQNKFGPKRNSDEGGINSRRRIKTAGIQKRKEFLKN